MRNAFKMLALAALAAILATPFAPAYAAPLPYYNQPLDTPNSAANAVVASINSGIPTAAVLQTATGSAAASTLNGVKGVITTESVTTAASATYTETVTNSAISANSIVLASVTSAGTGVPVVANVTPSAGQVIIKVQNASTTTAFNNTLQISFLVIN